ncbi:MAG: hypothetical protein NZ740_03030 [Kiritimatiellae bacterium]|nr:hypothetical protein [Kiritimatiellia bacterium]MDW8458066.1 hypothetical protein [Verrucomicrobiota bacterium]
MKPTRGELGERGIGATEIAPGAARVFVVGMLAALFGVSALEVRTAWTPAISAWSGLGGSRGWLGVNAALRDGLHAFEDRLREEAWLTKTLVPPLQRFKAEWLKLGNESVVLGADGWLHYAPDVAALTDRIPAEQLARAASAIRDFAAYLGGRGIDLILVPVPPKTAYAATTLAPRARATPIRRTEFAEFWRALERDHIRVFDPDSAWSNSPPESLYLRADTHWTFEAMERVAANLADRLRQLYGFAPPRSQRFERDEEAIFGIGDLARMLGDGLPPEWGAPQDQQIRPVRDGPFAWRPVAGSPVFLLGDSFSNIYSQEALGWGTGAGFAEQLSFHLGFPIDRIVRNDAGARGTRELLARELAAGRDRLAGVRVVVWQFAERELFHGDWRSVSFVLGTPRHTGFTPPPPSPAVWTATVAAVSAIPAPKRVPYADHIASIHLVDVAGEGAEGAEALAYAWSLTNHHRAAAARLRPGDRLRFAVRSWAEMADQLDGVNRSELDDDRFFDAEPVWVEPLP